MSLSKVKLVVSDMDGTLLNGRGEVSERFFELFSELQNRGIHFAAASGRQYYSISKKLDRIKNDITIIAENGGLAKKGETELLVAKMEQDKIARVIPILRTIPNAFIVLCGKNKAYIESKNDMFLALFQEYYASYELVNDLVSVTHDEFFKIAIYHDECSESHVYPAVAHLDKEIQIKVSGKNWVDISHFNANKGFALKMLQHHLGVTKEETMVFGDYNNDLEMMGEAHFSYAMENAHPNIKKIANFSTASNNDGGVELVLEELVKSRS